MRVLISILHFFYGSVELFLSSDPGDLGVSSRGLRGPLERHCRNYPEKLKVEVRDCYGNEITHEE